jgi:hypothetical protein
MAKLIYAVDPFTAARAWRLYVQQRLTRYRLLTTRFLDPGCPPVCCSES